MQQLPFVSPKRERNAFNCPLCGAYAQQEWHKIFGTMPHGIRKELGHPASSTCNHCSKSLIWNGDAIVIPEVISAPPANPDLNDDIKADYEEAASIVAKSPRGAAALLRLAVQKLCKQIGEAGMDINSDIASLVKKGLDVRVQQALDTVRVIGNEAVHPGEMNIRDDRETASSLFSLINLIADQTITQPRLRTELFDRLPSNKRESIKKRDSN